MKEGLRSERVNVRSTKYTKDLVKLMAKIHGVSDADIIATAVLNYYLDFIKTAPSVKNVSRETKF